MGNASGHAILAEETTDRTTVFIAVARDPIFLPHIQWPILRFILCCWVLPIQAQTMVDDRDSQVHLKPVLCLDSGSTTDIFCNEAFCKAIMEAGKSLTVDTNGGEATTSLEADVNDYGRVWFMKRALINIFSLFNMVKKYRVTFDSAVDNAFFVHKPNRLIRFGANDQGI